MATGMATSQAECTAMFQVIQHRLNALVDSMDRWYSGLAGEPISYSPEYPLANPYLAAVRRTGYIQDPRRELGAVSTSRKAGLGPPVAAAEIAA